MHNGRNLKLIEIEIMTRIRIKLNIERNEWMKEWKIV